MVTMLGWDIMRLQLSWKLLAANCLHPLALPSDSNYSILTISSAVSFIYYKIHQHMRKFSMYAVCEARRNALLETTVNHFLTVVHNY